MIRGNRWRQLTNTILQGLVMAHMLNAAWIPHQDKLINSLCDLEFWNAQLAKEEDIAKKK